MAGGPGRGPRAATLMKNGIANFLVNLRVRKMHATSQTASVNKQHARIRLSKVARNSVSRLAPPPTKTRILASMCVEIRSWGRDCATHQLLTITSALATSQAWAARIFPPTAFPASSHPPPAAPPTPNATDTSCLLLLLMLVRCTDAS